VAFVQLRIESHFTQVIGVRTQQGRMAFAAVGLGFELILWHPIGGLAVRANQMDSACHHFPAKTPRNLKMECLRRGNFGAKAAVGSLLKKYSGIENPWSLIA